MIQKDGYKFCLNRKLHCCHAEAWLEEFIGRQLGILRDWRRRRPGSSGCHDDSCCLLPSYKKAETVLLFWNAKNVIIFIIIGIIYFNKKWEHFRRILFFIAYTYESIFYFLFTFSYMNSKHTLWKCRCLVKRKLK